MNLRKAQQIIKKRSWFRLEKIPNRGPDEKRWRIIREDGTTAWEYDDTKLISHARHYTSESACKSAANRNVKYYSRRKNRRRTKEALEKEAFDQIPMEGPVFTENRWNWD